MSLAHKQTHMPIHDRDVNGVFTALMRSYLVDSASSYMLVLKIKPCMSKYMPY